MKDIEDGHASQQYLNNWEYSSSHWNSKALTCMINICNLNRPENSQSIKCTELLMCLYQKRIAGSSEWLKSIECKCFEMSLNSNHMHTHYKINLNCCYLASIWYNWNRFLSMSCNSHSLKEKCLRLQYIQCNLYCKKNNRHNLSKVKSKLSIVPKKLFHNQLDIMCIRYCKKNNRHNLSKMSNKLSIVLKKLLHNQLYTEDNLKGHKWGSS